MSTRHTQFALGLFAVLAMSAPSRGEDTLDAFFAAARGGDLAVIERMVGAGTDVNATTEYGATALSYASDKGHLSIVRFLLDKGANPSVRDTFYRATPMTWATQNGHLAVAVELVEHGAEAPTGLLASVAGSGKTDLLARLVKIGKFDSGGLTRALMITGPEDAETTAMLIAAGAKPVPTVSTKLLDEYAGKFELQPGVIIDVHRKENKLFVQLTGQEAFPLFAETETKFFTTAADATLTFERDDDGKVSRVVLNQSGSTQPAVRMAAGVTKPSKPTKSTEQTDPAIFEKYVGLYQSKKGDVFRVAIEDGRLVLGKDGKRLVAHRVRSEHVFQPRNNPTIAIRFQMEGETATGFIVDMGREKLVRTRMAEPLVEKAVRTAATNWPSFRGRNAGGVADGQGAPTKWSTETGEGIKWKTAIPGLGHSSPVVWGDRVFVTTAVSGKDAEFRAGPYGDVQSADDNTEHEWKVYCLDAKTGKIRWEKTAHKGLPRSERHTKASQASCTPAVTGTHVVVNFGSEGLFAFDHRGNLLWEKDLGVLDSGWFYDPTYQWGFSSSPVIFDNLIVVQADLNSESFIAAYDVSSGSEVWRTKRDELPSWGTPTIVESLGRVQVVTNSSKHIYGYDVRSGKELWRLAGNSEVTVGTPIVGHDLMFFTGGYTPFQPIYAVKVGASGDISLKEGVTKTEQVTWSTRRGGTYMPTPIVYEEYLYMCANNGRLTCYEARTGRRVYQSRIADGKAGSYTASPIAADGKLYFSSEDSGIFVVQAGPKYKLLSENPMDGIVMATPAISDGLMFIRTQHHLFAVGD